MDYAIKLCLFALIITAAALTFKDKNPHGAFLLAIAVCGFILYRTVEPVKGIMDNLSSLLSLTGLEGDVFLPLLKVLIVSICFKITTELCRDAGERAIAAQLEIAGAAIGIFLALPLITQALSMIGALR